MESAKAHKDWEMEYMTLYAKIQEEREEAAEEAAINQLIETAREYNASDDEIIKKIMTKFQLSEEEALDLINEYDKQLA